MISYRGMNHWSLPVQVFRKWRPLHPKIGIPACAQHCSEMNIVISICRYMRMYRYMYWSTSLNPVIASVYVGGSEMACLPQETRWLPSRAGKPYGIEALFAGEWDDPLLLDDKGRIFMDLDPSLFETIVEYLSTAKISGEENPVSRQIWCLLFVPWVLCRARKQEGGLLCSGVDNCSDIEDPMMQSFIYFFTNLEHGAQGEEYASTDDDVVEADEYFFPDKRRGGTISWRLWRPIVEESLSLLFPKQ